MFLPTKLQRVDITVSDSAHNPIKLCCRCSLVDTAVHERTFQKQPEINPVLRSLKLKLAEAPICFSIYRYYYEAFIGGLRYVTCEPRPASSSLFALACWKSVCTESWKSGNPSYGSTVKSFLEFVIKIPTTQKTEQQRQPNTLILLPK